MQSWITELRQLGPANLVLAITGNKLDLEQQRKVGGAWAQWAGLKVGMAEAVMASAGVCVCVCVCVRPAAGPAAGATLSRGGVCQRRRGHFLRD